MAIRPRQIPAGSATAVAALRRSPKPMPAPVALALERHQLLDAWFQRPEFQRQGYLEWIARARLDATRNQRLQQMLDELSRGDCYMSMVWRPRRPLA